MYETTPCTAHPDTNDTPLWACGVRVPTTKDITRGGRVPREYNARNAL